jgi:transcriptional regulator with XRE-family HTH domain
MNDRSFKAIGERLRITRDAMGLTQTAFRRAAELSPSTYNQFEKGGTRPSIDSALALCDAHGLSLDWIYRGDMRSLRHELAQAIKTLRKARE